MRLTCQPSPTANSISARSRLWPRASSCAFAMGPPRIKRSLRAAGYLSQSVLPLREQLAGERAHRVERGRGDSAGRLAVLDPMHRQAARRGAGIGFDGWHVGGEHADNDLGSSQ